MGTDTKVKEESSTQNNGLEHSNVHDGEGGGGGGGGPRHQQHYT